ncbi:FDXHR family putative zinc-binding protein [Mycobacterium sp. ML4]
MTAVERFSATQDPSPVSSIQTTPENRSARDRSTENHVCCASCGAWWTGLAAAHCSGCHQSFTSVGAFDRHRKGFECCDPETLRTESGEPAFVVADRSWPGWSLPGTWEGPRK